jgi:uncharacterized RDD family membrane protein YckC
VNAIAPSSAPVSGPSLDNRRVRAGLVDLGVVAGGTLLLNRVVGMVTGDGATFGPQMAFVSLAWALYYYFALESGDGQTLGKKLMKLRVVRADGGRTGMSEIAVRTVLRVVDGMFLYLVGLVVMLVTGQRRQRLGDIAAGTMVVDASSAPAPVAAAPAVASPPAPDFAPPSPAAEPAVVSPPAPEPVVASPPEPESPVVSQPMPEPEPEPEPAVVSPPEPEPAVVSSPEPEPVVASPTEPETAVVSPPAADPDAPQAPAYPVSTPVDIGSPLPGMAAPELPAAAPTYNPSTFNPSIAGVAAQPQAPDYPSADVVVEPPVEPPIEPVVQDPPAREPEVVVVSSDDDDDADDAEHMTVKAVETVSAMDLIMGDDDEDSPPPAQGDGPAGP